MCSTTAVSTPASSPSTTSLASLPCLLAQIANHSHVTVEHWADRNHAKAHDLFLQVHGQTISLAQRLQDLLAGASAQVFDELPHAALGNSDFAGEVEQAIELPHISAKRAPIAVFEGSRSSGACTGLWLAAATADRRECRFACASEFFQASHHFSLRQRQTFSHRIADA